MPMVYCLPLCMAQLNYLSARTARNARCCCCCRRRLPSAAQVQQHESVALPHLSLVEAGGVRLIFLVNNAAVQRVVRRTAALIL